MSDLDPVVIAALARDPVFMRGVVTAALMCDELAERREYETREHAGCAGPCCAVCGESGDTVDDLFEMVDERGEVRPGQVVCTSCMDARVERADTLCGVLP